MFLSVKVASPSWGAPNEWCDPEWLEPSFSQRGIARMFVPEEVLKCVVFIGIKKNGRFSPRATGFLVSFSEHGHRYHAIVTAEHVISGLLSKGHDLWWRINLKAGGAIEEKLNPALWEFHPKDGSTDVAISGYKIEQAEDVLSIGLDGPAGIIASAEIIKNQRIGIGDEVAIVGLFRSHYGSERNVPITRVGNIAMMKGEPVFTKYCGYTEAYLVEARSIAGLSGSPVFVNMPPLPGKIASPTPPQPRSSLYLLGLMHGHFDVQNLHEVIVTDAERDGTRGINTGIGVVIPVEKIMETILKPELVEMRRKVAEEYRKTHGATPDLDDDSASPDSDENPRHLEDFKRLVDVAAKKKAKD